MRFFSYPHSLNSSGARLNLFRIDNVQFHWNQTGSACLILVTSEMSDRSYYGERTLYFALSPSDKDMGGNNVCMVPLFGAARSSKQGTGGGNETQQVHCCCWHPDASMFCAVYGPFPARTALFRVSPLKPGQDVANCLHRIADIEPGTRNWAQFSKPDGRFLATGGFGGLRGDLQLWSVADPTQPRLMFSKHLPDVNTVEWSPDGAHLLVATLAPRLRVNNMFAIASLCRASEHVASGISLKIAFEWMPSTTDGQLWGVEMIKSYRTVKPTVQSTPRERTQQTRSNPIIQALESPSGVCINGQNRPISSQKQESVYVPPHLRKNQPQQAQQKPVASEAEQIQKKIKGLRRKLDDIDRLKQKIKTTEGNQLELNQMKKVEQEEVLRLELEQLMSISGEK